MMERKIAISLNHVSKTYQLGQLGGSTLNARLQSGLARLTGREDPNLPIGGKRETGGDFYALRDINLTIYQGETLGIIGPNGAGKSTLLKLLSHITTPTSGTIDLHGSVASLLEVGAGFHGEMTGRENVYLNGAILGMTRREITEKLDKIVEFSEIGPFLDTPVKRYSSGMYVKLAFSVAAHLSSEIMILDEVLAVGDMAFQKKCLDRMAAVARAGRTVLYVSHNMHTIRRLCDRCILLEGGRITYDGDPEEAIGRYLGTGAESPVRNCDSLPREPICRGGARILETRIPHTVLGRENNLHLHMKFRAEETLPDLRFRLVLFSGGSPVGLVTGKHGFSADAGENQVEMELDLGLLAPGSYTGRAVLYESNPYGGEKILDVADPAVIFRKEENDTGDGTQVWKPSVWGHIRFPAAEVKLCD